MNDIPYPDHIEQLQALIDSQKLQEDLSYYSAERRLTSIGVSVPPEMRQLLAQVGWPRTYVNSLEERLDIEGFQLPGELAADERLHSWWQANQLDVESSLGHADALIHGRAYVTIAAPDEEDPLSDPTMPSIRVESPFNLVAETDPRTRRVTRALRIITNEETGQAESATLYLPETTAMLTYSGGSWTVDQEIRHGLGIVPVVPLVNRSRLSDRMGTSEIIPELRSITDAAARIMMDMQAAAELMAVPQRMLFGVAAEALRTNPDDPGSALESYFSRIIAIEDPDASATQFTAADLRNFVEVLQELAKQAASYTGLPPQYLSFSSENPASAEAIKAAESRLVKKAERKARMFGEAWEQALRIAMLIMDGKVPEQAHRMETLWRDPSTPTYAAKADAVSKLVSTQTADGRSILPLEQARIELGYSSEARRKMREQDQESPTAQLSQLLGTGRQSIPTPQEEDDQPGAEAA